MFIKKLEAIRGFAACYVVVHHLFGFTELDSALSPIIRFPFRFGQEAVILFFLLSGFVIYLSVHNKQDIKFRSYLTKRFRRIYPIAFISMLLSLAVVKFNGDAITSQDYVSLLGNLIMMQDLNNKPGNWFNVFLENHALWSLSYEWWFYVLFFPLYKNLPKHQSRIYLILLISILSWFSYLVFPNHFSLIISYLIVWWSGLECAVVFIRDKNFTYHSIKHILLCLLIMTLVSTIPLVDQFFNGSINYSVISYPIVNFRHFAFAFVSVLVGLLWWKCKLLTFNFVFSPFQELAPISYGIYVIHFPIIWLDTKASTSHLFFELWLKIVLILGIAYLLERKLQPAINRLIQ